MLNADFDLTSSGEYRALLDMLCRSWAQALGLKRSTCCFVQAILYQDDRAIGRLLQPHLSAQEIHSTGVIQTELPETKGIAVEFISIQYKCWQAARARQEQQPKQLCLPVDKAFTESSYRIQVIDAGKRFFTSPTQISYHVYLSSQSVTFPWAAETVKDQKEAIK